MTGFLEESAGVRSVTRLIAVIITLLAVVIVGLIVWYVVASVLHAKSPDAGVLAALGGILAAVVAHGAVAIIRRGTGEPDA
jgi:hypothetical protein